jgi:hypothetical protein
MLELELEFSKVEDVELLPYYTSVDSRGFCSRDYDKIRDMILLKALVKCGLVLYLGWQLPNIDRKEVWPNPQTDDGIDYTVNGLFDSKAQCFDMGN